jgi:hypothetical protein
MVVAAMVYSGTHLAPPDTPEPSIANIFRSIAQPIGIAELVGLVIGPPLTPVYRRAHREQLRQKLPSLLPHERAAILLPLQSEPLSDTRRIVAPLLREFGVPPKLSPASAPTGRGDEPMP